MTNTCIIVAGPTAIGKTSLAIQLAKHFSTEIISADSRQCYRELNIGVAKPSPEELAEVKHHFIDSHSIHDELSVAGFEEYALEKIQGIFTNSNIAIMVGGTGLYIKAFAEGLDEIPAVDPAIRQTIIRKFETEGLSSLQDEIQKVDQEFFEGGEIHNPQRLMRALEVKLSTGRSIGSFQTGKRKFRPFNTIKLNLELPRIELYNRINHRVEVMMEHGLEAEVASLRPFQQLNALQTVGYKELFDYFDGKVSYDKAIELIKQNTRHYAKRQVTWFKKDAEMQSCIPALDEALEIINTSL
jgi:tRNA dimethylallyltransferase